MRILVAEDERITRRSLQRQLEGWGHDVVATADGAEAWEEFQQQQFDIVVTDWDMPRVDGRELIERIRSSHRAGYVYLIMLTARSEKSDLIRGMEAGADDFLAKPFDREELRVRLRAGQRVIELERDLAARNEQLNAANERMRSDMEAAARVQQMLLPREAPDTDSAQFAWLYRPCDQLAGDALNVFRLDDSHVGLYVLDVTGHGVQASLLSVMVTRALSPRSDRFSLVTRPIDDSPGFEIVPPAQVVGQLNRSFPMEDSGQFVTLVYGILDLQTGQFRYTCAGHPRPFHARPNETVLCHDAPALPVGIMPEADYGESIIELQPRDRLFLYSDGLLEEPNSAGEQFGTSRSQAAIIEGQALSLDRNIDLMCDKLVSWHGEDQLKDDLTIVGVELS